MARGGWQSTFHGVAESRTWLSEHFHFHCTYLQNLFLLWWELLRFTLLATSHMQYSIPMVTMLYIISPGLMHFITGSLCLHPLYPICPPLTPCIWQPPYIFTSNFFYSTYKEIIWYLSFSIWLISHRKMPSRSIHVVANGKISSHFIAE